MKAFLVIPLMLLASCGGDRLPPNCTQTPTGKTVVETNVRVHSKTRYDIIIESCTYHQYKRVNPRKA